MTAWAPPARIAWPLEGQVAACGLEVPTVTRDTWHFLRGRLVAHVCRVKGCAECLAASRLGWRTVRVTREEIADGRALDRVAGLLWTTREGSLF